MSELRKDPLSGTWTILSPERPLHRADLVPAWPEAAPGESQRAPAACPLCPGNEGHTPHEVYAHRPAEGPGAVRNAPGWQVRVVPHKFPALGIEGDLDRRGVGLYDRVGGVGAHEVLIESPDHQRQTFALTPQEVELVLWACRHRIGDLKRDQRFRYLQVFKAHGERAGAALYHAHTQLLALPVVPQAVVAELDGAERHFRHRERCLLCDVLQHEVLERQRLVYENRAAVVLSPYAARVPFEMWIVPRQHCSAFEDHPGGDLGLLAEAVLVALRKLRLALDDPPYRYTLHNAPFSEGQKPYLHWHWKVLPVVGGSDWGGGCYVNPTPPEEAAHYLRGLET